MIATKPTIIKNCLECQKPFSTWLHRESDFCLKCREKKYQQKYFEQKRALDPEWNKKRSQKNLVYALSTKTKLRLARIAMDRLLVRVQKQREKIKKLEEEARNG